MAMLLKENVPFTIVGDGSSVTATFDLAASPLGKSFERRFPDRVVVTVSGFTVASSSFKGSAVTFTLTAAVSSGNGAIGNCALEYDV